jgi:hypothetical protein
MNISNRDLLVLSKKSDLHPEALQQEIECLNILLNNAEAMSKFCVANEVINVNRLTIITKPKMVELAIRKRANKPFVFISNKN